MIDAVVRAARRVSDAWLGRGEHAVTLPPMDGALKPNGALEEAALLLRAPSPDNLVVADATLHFSSGASLMAARGETGEATELHRFAHDVTATCALPDGRIAVALESGDLHLWRAGRAPERLAPQGGHAFTCITALLATAAGDLLVAEGSSLHRPADWRRDLLERRRAGSVWRLPAGGGAPQRLAADLAWPSGLALAADGSVVVCEAWAHRIARIEPSGATTTLLGDLPGYPWRLAPGRGGHAWLAVAAPRSQLVEFVLREPEFKRRMMAEIAEAYWVAPAFGSGEDFKEPLQGGAIKSMGILKPWAPTRSYGLLVELNDRFEPVRSLHSRADGKRHGIASVATLGDRVLAASRGGHQILSIPVAGEAP